MTMDEASSQNESRLARQKKLRVLELFSGIGGMRCGLTEGFPHETKFEFTSVDMNEFCNQVYYTSFGDQPV
jgi:site-specific DNA-cytosine methylase